MRIKFKTIPHRKQRYPTLGDYWWDKDGTLQVRASEMGDEDLEFLIFIHEVQEAWLCKKRGITEPEVTKFDLEFEKTHMLNEEPGEDPKAPYHKEHIFVECLERLLAIELGIPWKRYIDTAMKLFERK